MSWYDAIKDVAAVVDRINDADLLKAMANLKIEGAELAEQNAKLRDENRDLKEKLSVKEEFVFEKNLYWKKSPDGNISEGPFCPSCFSGKDKAVRMIAERGEYITDFYDCPVCNMKIDDENGIPKKSISSGRPMY
jgi:regulator of replication initiation timing